jgi:uncharacterized BrkB/YihY/UPF0761 family membrane protein
MQNKLLRLMLILAPISFLLHNAEESITMVKFIQQNMERLPAPIRWLEVTLQLNQASFILPVAILTLLLAWVSIRLLLPNAPAWMRFIWPVAILTLCANVLSIWVKPSGCGATLPG